MTDFAYPESVNECICPASNDCQTHPVHISSSTNPVGTLCGSPTGTRSNDFTRVTCAACLREGSGRLLAAIKDLDT